MEIIGRDKISQAGVKNRIKIDNSHNKEYNWLIKTVLAIFSGVIIAGINYWIGWN